MIVSLIGAIRRENAMKRMIWVCLLVFGLMLSWTVLIGADFYVITGYDAKGRLSRTNQGFPMLLRPNYPTYWWYVSWLNPITMHNTIWEWKIHANPAPKVHKDEFSFRWLLKQAR